ncbi:MAG: hypothetical protein ACODAJ_07235 [Planctomycetota bacterium]
MRLAFTLVLAILPALAAADVVHLADGTTREGRIVETSETHVVLDVGVGNVSLQVRIPRGDVVRIEHGASTHDKLMADYARRLSRVRTADDWYALGAWCQDQRVLKEEARGAWQRALALDPDHADTHRALGHVRLNGEWMSRQRAVTLLAPELTDDLAEARQGTLAARRDAEQAQARALEAQKRIEELESDLEEARKQNKTLRARLANPPPPRVVERERVIYRPIIIRPPHHRRRRPDDSDDDAKAKPKPSPKSSQPTTPAPPADDSAPDEGSE